MAPQASEESDHWFFCTLLLLPASAATLITRGLVACNSHYLPG